MANLDFQGRSPSNNMAGWKNTIFLIGDASSIRVHFSIVILVFGGVDKDKDTPAKRRRENPHLSVYQHWWICTITMVWGVWSHIFWAVSPLGWIFFWRSRSLHPKFLVDRKGVVKDVRQPQNKRPYILVKNPHLCCCNWMKPVNKNEQFSDFIIYTSLLQIVMYHEDH